MIFYQGSLISLTPPVIPNIKKHTTIIANSVDQNMEVRIPLIASWPKPVYCGLSPNRPWLPLSLGRNYLLKNLDLTYRSPESEMCYADFLIQSGEYKELEAVANDLAKSNKPT